MSVGVMTLGLVAAKRQIDAGNDVNGLVCDAFAPMLASRFFMDPPLGLGRPGHVGPGSRTPPRRRRCSRCGIPDRADVVHPTRGFPRTQRWLVAVRCVRLVSGDRACLPGLLCGESPLFGSPLNLLSAIGRTG